jgi:vacuole morphology and inheritance protein 14
MFPKIFSTLSTLVTDPDQQVKNGSELLDRLLKDIITENSQTFDLPSFIPLLRERVYSKSSFSRQFVISWISVLNAVPEINLLVYLPEILDGLFHMLDDNVVEIHRMCDTLLGQFLKGVRNDPISADIPTMTNILIGHANANNDLIQYTSMKWLREFVNLSGTNMLQFASGIFSAILPCLAYDSEHKRHIKDCAQEINKNLLALISHQDENPDAKESLKNLDLDSVMEVLRQYLTVQSSVPTKVAVLKWIHFLFTEINDEVRML